MSVEGPSTSHDSSSTTSQSESNGNPVQEDSGFFASLQKKLQKLERKPKPTKEKRKVEFLPGMSTSRETLLTSSLPASEQTAWQRVASIYGTPTTMEYDLMKHTSKATFWFGFVLGGLRTISESERRFELITTGQTYLSPNDARVRRMDFKILRFIRGGFKFGFLTSCLSTSMVILVTHTAAYRNHFSSWYFPLYSGAFGLVHRLAVLVGTALFSSTGLTGLISGILMGTLSGSILGGTSQLFAIYFDKTGDEVYKMFKKEYEFELYEREVFDKRVNHLIKKEKMRTSEALKLAGMEKEERMKNSSWKVAERDEKARQHDAQLEVDRD